MVYARGVPKAAQAFFFKIPLFHIPLFGGWRDYVVVEPISLQGEEWYVGWVTGEVNGVSRIPLKGAARLLRGRDDASFFGVNREGGQIPLQQCGHGRIGVRGPYARIPLR